MKYLSDYTNNPITAMMDKLGAFFAFGSDQFHESAVKGEKYASLGAGLIVPKSNAAALVDGLDKITEEGIAADKADHTPEQIILRELRNYECFYTGDPSDAIDKLKAYGDGFGEKEVGKVFGQLWEEECAS